MSKELRVIVCAFCHNTKNVRYPGEVQKRRYCSRGCAVRHRKANMRGHAPLAAVAARRSQADARAQEHAAEAFGPLTAREVAIWRHGQASGYGTGYHAAYRSLPATSRRVA
jgi:hypothetical protein